MGQMDVETKKPLTIGANEFVLRAVTCGEKNHFFFAVHKDGAQQII